MKHITFKGSPEEITFWVRAWVKYHEKNLVKAGITGVYGHSFEYTIYYNYS